MWLPLHEDVPAAPDDFLVLPKPGNGFQDELLHCLPRNEVQPEHSVLPWALILALLAARRDICFPPVLGHFCWSPGLIPDDQESDLAWTSASSLCSHG